MRVSRASDDRGWVMSHGELTLFFCSVRYSRHVEGNYHLCDERGYSIAIVEGEIAEKVTAIVWKGVAG